MVEITDKGKKKILPNTSLKSLERGIGDEVVVKQICQGDKESYSIIIKRYQPKLLRYAISILGDSQDAADAVQTGFIKAYVNLNSFNPNKPFSSWLYRIIHNEAINLINHHKHQQRFDNDYNQDSGVNLEDDVVKAQLITHTHQCLQHMAVIYREPLVLYFLEEKSYEEISDILRLPLGTVGTRINRAKGILRHLCQKKHP